MNPMERRVCGKGEAAFLSNDCQGLIGRGRKKLVEKHWSHRGTRLSGLQMTVNTKGLGVLSTGLWLWGAG